MLVCRAFGFHDLNQDALLCRNSGRVPKVDNDLDPGGATPQAAMRYSPDRRAPADHIHQFAGGFLPPQTPGFALEFIELVGDIGPSGLHGRKPSRVFRGKALHRRFGERAHDIFPRQPIEQPFRRQPKQGAGPGRRPPPACGGSAELPQAGAAGVTVNLVFDPPWDQSKMSEEAQLELGFL